MFCPLPADVAQPVEQRFRKPTFSRGETDQLGNGYPFEWTLTPDRQENANLPP